MLKAIFFSRFYSILKASFCLLLLAVALNACQHLPEHMVLKRIQYDKLGGWNDADSEVFVTAHKAFLRTCDRFDELSPNMKLRGDAGRVKDWADVCTRARAINPSSARVFFEENFTPVAVYNNAKRDGLFTGYYEIELHGSRQKTERYRYPIYRMPRGGKHGMPSRASIDNGALKNRGLELLYVDDPVELFFLHIQGSGRVKLDNGETVRVGYNGQNGFKYVPIGAVLWKRGYMAKEEVTAQKIKEWLRANPSQANSIMHTNPSYVFFREMDLADDEGPRGAHDVPLTANASLAVDKTRMPFGVPLWLETTLPGKYEGTPFNRLVIAQDTGGAIKGAVRGDIFFGHGELAEYLAGKMQNRGRYAMLLPNHLARQLGE